MLPSQARPGLAWPRPPVPPPAAPPTFSSRAMSPLGVSTARLKKQTPPRADTPCRQAGRQAAPAAAGGRRQMGGELLRQRLATSKWRQPAAQPPHWHSPPQFAADSTGAQRLHAHLKVDALLAALLERSLQAGGGAGGSDAAAPAAAAASSGGQRGSSGGQRGPSRPDDAAAPKGRRQHGPQAPEPEHRRQPAAEPMQCHQQAAEAALMWAQFRGGARGD